MRTRSGVAEMARKPRPSRVPRSILRRGVYSILAIVAVVIFTTVGLHLLEGHSYLDSFYFTAMLATGEGPNTAPVTSAGKIFVGVMAFVSVGTVISALLFIFGPLFSQIAREGVELVEEEVEKERKKGEE